VAPLFNPLGPTDELISFALAHPPTGDFPDPHWEVIALLHERGTRETFTAATRLLASRCPTERALGVNIHAQLRYQQQKPFAAESVRLLTQLLEVEDDPNVIYAALIAFGHLHQPECVSVAIRFANHPDSDIRYAVAFGLAGQDDERSIGTLIALTNDPDVRVRDWATFDLGSQTEWDSPELRAALRARLGDPDNITRGEALKGLALRTDEHAIEAIVAELTGPDPHASAVEAAEELADSRLVPALEALRTRWPGNPWLERVIETCRAGR
jgi:HEAT repeat protein